MKFIKKKIIYGCEGRGDAESPYLTRYTLLDTKRGQLCLHIFHRSDADDHHDHPWPFWTLILWRGYTEVTPTGRRRLWPGMVLFRPATWRHRVELLKNLCPACCGPLTEVCLSYLPCSICNGTRFVQPERPAVTLVWKGSREREWGFFTGRGWQKWQDYFRDNKC